MILQTPGPWVWARFGGDLMLVTASGGSKVVLCAGGGGRTRPHLQVRGENGTLEPLQAGHPVAHMLKASPNALIGCRDALRLLTDDNGLIGSCREAIQERDRVVALLQAAIDEATGGQE